MCHKVRSQFTQAGNGIYSNNIHSKFGTEIVVHGTACVMVLKAIFSSQNHYATNFLFAQALTSHVIIFLPWALL